MNSFIVLVGVTLLIVLVWIAATLTKIEILIESYLSTQKRTAQDLINALKRELQ